MELIPLYDIATAEDRQRQLIDEGSIIDLADDIERIGLMHPLVLRNEENVLVAGERRLRAIQLLNDGNRIFECNGHVVPAGHAPVTRLSDREEVDYYEAELYENLSRVDLSWKDQSLAKAKLHSLRLAQTGGTQTLTATAKELAPDPSTAPNVAGLSEDVRLAANLDDEEIAKAKTKRDALKILDRKQNEQRNAELAKEWKGLTDRTSPHVLRRGNATDLLRELPDNQFDVIITDPPYGIDAERFGDQTLIDHNYNDSYDMWTGLMKVLAYEGMRVTKPQAHAYVFCDISNFFDLLDIFHCRDWSVWPRPIIWYKGNIGTLPRPKHGPRYTYECILYAIKGDRTTHRVGAHDVIQIPAVQKSRHAAEKPIGVYATLLARSAWANDNVLDPFCGSGTIFPAANHLHLNATGFELDEASFNLALSRMGEEYD